MPGEGGVKQAPPTEWEELRLGEGGALPGARPLRRVQGRVGGVKPKPHPVREKDQCHERAGHCLEPTHCQEGAGRQGRAEAPPTE
jgi:hypothetical protein